MPSSTAPSPERASSPTLKAPKLMAVVNVTPDSFYAPSRTPTYDEAVARGVRLAAEGADYLDVGGVSTRPGSEPPSVEEELDRVVPVIAALSKRVAIPISVDTFRARVAAAALEAGATILNDVTALRGDKNMPAVAARAERVILMHMLGDAPKTMQLKPTYADVVGEVMDFLRERLRAFAAAGGDLDRVWVDPGIGFGKTLAHNLTLIRRVSELSALAPVVLGVSRKAMFSALSPDAGPEDRLAGSLGVAAWAATANVEVLRVHDVAETRRALAALTAIAGAA